MSDIEVKACGGVVHAVIHTFDKGYQKATTHTVRGRKNLGDKRRDEAVDLVSDPSIKLHMDPVLKEEFWLKHDRLKARRAQIGTTKSWLDRLEVAHLYANEAWDLKDVGKTSSSTTDAMIKRFGLPRASALATQEATDMQPHAGAAQAGVVNVSGVNGPVYIFNNAVVNNHNIPPSQEGHANQYGVVNVTASTGPVYIVNQPGINLNFSAPPSHEQVPEANPADPTLKAAGQAPPVLSSPSTECLASQVFQDAVSVLEAVDGDE